MLKDKLAERKTSLAEQGAFAIIQGKRTYDLWNKIRATLEEYKNILRSCREKIRKAIAQL